MKRLVILGAAGFAREVAWLVGEINAQEPEWELVGFADRAASGVPRLLNGFPVLTVEAAAGGADTWAVAAIGSPESRERAVMEAAAHRFRFAMLVHPAVRMDGRPVEVGAGTIICAGNILTVNIVVGQHVIINLDCTIGHDSRIEDFVTISPGAHLSGHSVLRRGAYIGTGAVTVEQHEIGAGAVVGAGGAVVRDVPAGVTAVGVPAKPLLK